MSEYYTDWKEACIAAQKIVGKSFDKWCDYSVYTLHVAPNETFNVDEVKKERGCDAVHVVFTEENKKMINNRFEILDL